MAKKQRRYTDNERSNALAALAANGGNVKKTARQLGIPAKTIDNWSKGAVHPEVATSGNEKKRDLAETLEAIAFKLADAIPGKIEKAGLQQLATSLGIAIDKARLLRGEPTAITQHNPDGKSKDELLAELNALRQRRALRASGRS